MDEQILFLLNQRIQVATALGELKREAGVNVHDAEREDSVLRRVTKLNSGPLDQDSALRIFRAIIEAARRAQEELR
jgi:chorismate mutase/prephenate dehydratase